MLSTSVRLAVPRLRRPCRSALRAQRDYNAASRANPSWRLRRGGLAYFFGDPFAGLAVGMLLGRRRVDPRRRWGSLRRQPGRDRNRYQRLRSWCDRLSLAAYRWEQANTLRLPGSRGSIFRPFVDPDHRTGSVFPRPSRSTVLFATAALVYCLLYWTPWGLKVRAVGENPAAADSAGVSVVRTRYVCVSPPVRWPRWRLLPSPVGRSSFSENISAGQGFHRAGGSDPWPLAPARRRWRPACCSAFSDALQLRLQFDYPDVPHEFFVMLPVLVLDHGARGIQVRPSPPAAIGIHYKRKAK